MMLKLIPRSKITRINISFVILMSAGMYGFYLTKKSVDRRRFELMKSRQNFRAERMQEMQDKLGKDV